MLHWGLDVVPLPSGLFRLRLCRLAESGLLRVHVPLQPVSEGLRGLPDRCYLVDELMGVHPVCVRPVLDDCGAFPAEVVDTQVFSGVAAWGCLERGISARESSSSLIDEVRPAAAPTPKQEWLVGERAPG